MTDKEIIKALKKHSMNLCSECKVQKTTLCNDCISEIQRNALDLINRQQAEIQAITEKFNCQQTVYADLSKIIKDQKAEIERLKEENKILDLNRRMALLEKEPLYDKIKTARAEAIKEFVEKLKNSKPLEHKGTLYYETFTIREVDKLAKEMIGE